MANLIAFQGEYGAYSHQACIEARPEYEPLPCSTFEDVVSAVTTGHAVHAMLPVENSIYGRVADIHRLLPESGLFIVDEVFVRIHINLLVVPGTKIADISHALSHTVLLGQCRKFFVENGIVPQNWVDTAGAARHISNLKDPSKAALASELAGSIYGLEIAQKNIEDEQYNRTRFVIMAREVNNTKRGRLMMTSFVFQVRNIPASLYKGLGGFATNNINMVKLESYMVGGSFSATQFFAEIEGHPDDPGVILAMQELDFFTNHISIVGTYPASPDRFNNQLQI